MEETETIAALSTGKGNAALAIIRISGKKTFEILAKCLKPEKGFLRYQEKEIRLYQFHNKKNKCKSKELFYLWTAVTLSLWLRDNQI